MRFGKAATDPAAPDGNSSATLWRLASDGSQLEQQAEMPGQTPALRRWGAGRQQQLMVVSPLQQGHEQLRGAHVL